MQEIRLNLFNYIFLLDVNALFIIIQTWPTATDTIFQEKNCILIYTLQNNDKFIH